jgi:hypothetical protein
MSPDNAGDDCLTSYVMSARQMGRQVLSTMDDGQHVNRLAVRDMLPSNYHGTPAVERPS